MSAEQPKRNSRFWVDLEPLALERYHRLKDQLTKEMGRTQSATDIMSYLLAQYFKDQDLTE